MRARNIKPGFYKNEILAECHPLSRILFSGLWCLADRSGRLEDRPKRIKADVLPYDNCDINKLLNELASKNDSDGKPAFIIRYSVGGSNYIQILHFLGHQNPHVREPESSIPEPDKNSACTVLAPDKHGSGPADSPSLIPDSPIPFPDSVATDESVLTLPLVQGEFSITTPKVKEWEELFPSLDVMQCIRDCKGWNLSNPGKRKTRKGIERHIVGWLTRANDKGQHRRPIDGNPRDNSGHDNVFLRSPIQKQTTG